MLVHPLLNTLFLLVLLVGCREEVEPPMPLLRVGQQQVTQDVFLRDFHASLRGKRLSSPAVELRHQRVFMAQLVDRLLLQQEAERLGLSVTKAEVDQAVDEVRADYPDNTFENLLSDEKVSFEFWQQNLAHRLLINKLSEKILADRVDITEEEIRQYYEANKKEFYRPKTVWARHLMVATEEEGQTALERVRSGEDFATVAREVSLAPDAQEGGDLGYFARGQMPPEFDDVVFILRSGRLSNLVKTPYGWHVFKVEKNLYARQLKLEEVSDRIRQKLEKTMAEEIFQQWLTDLRTQAKIEIDWSQLAHNE